MFGRQARILADVMFGTPLSTTQSVNEFAATLRKQLEKAFNLARHQSLTKQLRQKELSDKKIHGFIPPDECFISSIARARRCFLF